LDCKKKNKVEVKLLFENEMLDSLAIIEVLLGIEDKLDLSLQPTDLERKDMATVNNLVDFLKDRI